MVRFGFRIPSLKKRLSARTSLKRAIRHRAGLKAPRGWGWITNPNTGAAPAFYIPTENEWYKAAYYSPTKGGNGGYYTYATQSDTASGNFESLIYRPVSTRPDWLKAWRNEANYLLFLARRASDADDVELLEELEDQAREMADMVEARWQRDGL